MTTEHHSPAEQADALVAGPPSDAARLLRPPLPPEGGPLPFSPATTDSQLRWVPAEAAVYFRQDGTHASYIVWENPDGTASVAALATRRVLDTDDIAAARAIASACEENLGRSAF